MKPLGTSDATENGLTTPKSTFGKLISQCGFSTKNRLSVAPLRQHQRTKQPLGQLAETGFGPSTMNLCTKQLSAKF
nr:hypothetical protein [Vibrio hyugaensis]